MITVTFACGHDMQASGDERDIRCGCGETRVQRVVAKAPRFRGHAFGPCSQFVNLPPTAVTLETP